MGFHEGELGDGLLRKTQREYPAVFWSICFVSLLLRDLLGGLNARQNLELVVVNER